MSNDQQIDISVVIGFKDWGLERLLLSVAALNRSFGNRRGEVIISDFGSVNGQEIEKAVTASGARYHRTETDGTWSRSRAINAGYAVAQGRVLVATDADMLFSPRAMEIIANSVLTDPNTAVVLQCRDLPATHSSEHLDSESLNWTELETVSQLRPRWGMGGMFAASRERVGLVGGYDNRMHTYGGEDLDFAQRIRRSGAPVIWIEDPQVRMYHIWHPPTINTVSKSADATSAVAANRKILRTDSTWKRNEEFDQWTMPFAPAALTVIVHVQETDLNAARVLNSLSRQTNINCEIVVLHDSSTISRDLQVFAGYEKFSFSKTSSHIADDIRLVLKKCETPFISILDGQTVLADNSLAELFSSHSASVHAVWAPIRLFSSLEKVCISPTIETEGHHVVSGASTGHSSVAIFSTKLLKTLDIDGSSVVCILREILDDIESNHGSIVMVPRFLGLAIFSLPETALRSTYPNWVRTVRCDDFESSWDKAAPGLTIRYPEEQHEGGFLARLAPRDMFRTNLTVTARNQNQIDGVKELLNRGSSWTLVEDQSGRPVTFEAQIPDADEHLLKNLENLDVEIAEYSEFGSLAKLSYSLDPIEISDIMIRSIFSKDIDGQQGYSGLYAVAYGNGKFPVEIFDDLDKAGLVFPTDSQQTFTTKSAKMWLWVRAHSGGLNDNGLDNMINILTMSGIDVGIMSPTRSESFRSILESSAMGESN